MGHFYSELSKHFLCLIYKFQIWNITFGIKSQFTWQIIETFFKFLYEILDIFFLLLQNFEQLSSGLLGYLKEFAAICRLKAIIPIKYVGFSFRKFRTQLLCPLINHTRNCIIFNFYNPWFDIFFRKMTSTGWYFTSDQNGGFFFYLLEVFFLLLSHIGFQFSF